jgi:hypothetical protein
MLAMVPATRRHVGDTCEHLGVDVVDQVRAVLGLTLISGIGSCGSVASNYAGKQTLSTKNAGNCISTCSNRWGLTRFLAPSLVPYSNTSNSA